MNKHMSDQMQKLAARYEKATGKKFDAQTNAQKIRSMTDEELAQFLNQWGTSTRAWQKNKGETMYWLQQTAEEDDHER